MRFEKYEKPIKQHLDEARLRLWEEAMIKRTHLVHLEGGENLVSPQL